MKLHFRKFGEGHPLFVLHGVFGSADNWQTLAKYFAENNSVYLLDQRNHGNSPHSEVMTYEAMADDLKELMDDEGLSQIHLLGHSMGGKTAMAFGMKYPDLLNKLIVVDIAPKYYPPHHQQIFEGFHAVNLQTLTSRKEAEDIMASTIKDFGVRQFILKNLTRNTQNEFAWKVNLDVIEKNIEIIGEGLNTNQTWSGEALFIAGGKSQYILAEDEIIIKNYFPKAVIKSIDGSGHWVHAEKPQELLKMVQEFLSHS